MIIGTSASRRTMRLSPEVSRILYLRNLPYKISAEELYDIFGKYGSVRQIRKVTPQELTVQPSWFMTTFMTPKTRWITSGFNVAGRYLVVLYYNPSRLNKRKDLDKEQEELNRVKEALNMNKK